MIDIPSIIRNKIFENHVLIGDFVETEEVCEKHEVYHIRDDQGKDMEIFIDWPEMQYSERYIGAPIYFDIDINENTEVSFTRV